MVGSDEVTVVVGRDEADRGRRLREAEPDLGLDDGVTPDLAEVCGHPHEVMDELRILEGVEQHHLRIAQEHGDGPGADGDGAHGGGRRGLDESLALFDEAREPRRLVRIRHA